MHNQLNVSGPIESEGGHSADEAAMFQHFLRTALTNNWQSVEQRTAIMAAVSSSSPSSFSIWLKFTNTTLSEFRWGWKKQHPFSMLGGVASENEYRERENVKQHKNKCCTTAPSRSGWWRRMVPEDATLMLLSRVSCFVLWREISMPRVRGCGLQLCCVRVSALRHYGLTSCLISGWCSIEGCNFTAGGEL